MHRMSRFTLSVATAALLATSVAAPADARRYRHWDHDRGLDAGDVIVGAAIIGGIAVLASEIAKSHDNNGTVFGGDRKREGNTERAAVDACTDAAEQRAAQSGRNGRVADITKVDRDGDRFQVRGTIEYRVDGGWGDRDDRRDDRRDWQDRARFTCTYSYGRVDGIWLDDGYAWR